MILFYLINTIASLGLAWVSRPYGTEFWIGIICGVVNLTEFIIFTGVSS